MAELFWTKRVPTADGWYWWRRGIEWEAEVVHVLASVLASLNRRGLYRGGEWYGPLVPPGGDAVENCAPPGEARG